MVDPVHGRLLSGIMEISRVEWIQSYSTWACLMVSNLWLVSATFALLIFKFGSFFTIAKCLKYMHACPWYYAMQGILCCSSSRRWRCKKLWLLWSEHPTGCSAQQGPRPLRPLLLLGDETSLLARVSILSHDEGFVGTRVVVWVHEAHVKAGGKPAWGGWTHFPSIYSVYSSMT